MKKNDKVNGYIMAIAGFFMIMVNALRYVFDDNVLPVLGILGIVFVVIGIKMAKGK